MAYPCGRENGLAPIQELYRLPLASNELAFIYLGFAGIIVKVNERFFAFDVGKDCIRQEEIEALESLDLQFYSHTHWDHWDLSVTMSIVEITGAPVVADPSVVDEMKTNLSPDLLKSATPNHSLTLKNVAISAVPGIHPRPITLFHVTFDNFRLFHGADSGYVPLTGHPAEIAFIPTGTPSPSCSPKNALKMALDVKSQVVVGMHGNPKQLRDFRDLLHKKSPQTRIILPKPCELVKVQLADA